MKYLLLTNRIFEASVVLLHTYVYIRLFVYGTAQLKLDTPMLRLAYMHDYTQNWFLTCQNPLLYCQCYNGSYLCTFIATVVLLHDAMPRVVLYLLCACVMHMVCVCHMRVTRMDRSSCG